MFLQNFQAKMLALALGLAVVSLGDVQNLSATSGKSLMAKDKDKLHQFVNPAQVLLQDSSTITPILNQPITFDTVNIQEHIKLEQNNSVIEIKQGGLYDITGAFTVQTLTPPEAFTISILINGKSYMNFQDNDTSSTTTPPFPPSASSVEGTLYLKEGDKVSFVLESAPVGATIGARFAEVINLNNIKD
jgi:hypothetical protein